MSADLRLEPTEILQALVGLKDVRVLRYEGRGPHVSLMVEQVPGVVHCPACQRVAQVKEGPVVHYIDLPVYGTPMSLAWRKHRMRCADGGCPEELDAGGPLHRRQELPAHHQGGQVGDGPGRWRPDGLHRLRRGPQRSTIHRPRERLSID
jgi:hypothetical protein